MPEHWHLVLTIIKERIGIFFRDAILTIILRSVEDREHRHPRYLWNHIQNNTLIVSLFRYTTICLTAC